MEYANQYKNISKKEEMHYFGQILPFIAAYKVLQKYGENADIVLEEIIER